MGAELMAMDFSDEHAALVNEILPRLGAIGAYRLGIASALALSAGLEPTRYLLEASANSGSSGASVEFCKQWIASAQSIKTRKRRRRNADPR
jgi:hypothetical protein